MTFRAREYDLVAILLWVILFGFSAWLFIGFIVDDAFISFRYVQQFARGNGLVYNLNERVEGYSNFLWLMLLTPFELMGFELTVVAKLLGIFLSLLALGVTWRFGHLLSGRTGFHLIAPTLLAATGSFGAWSVGGLETPLFTFLLISAVYLFAREEKDAIRPTFSGALFALLSLTRPEGAFFFGVIVAYRILHVWQTHARFSRRDAFRIAGFTLIFAPYFWWRLNYYGFLLPNTVYAKSLGLHPRALLEGAIYLYDLVRAAGGIFYVTLAIILSFFNRKQRDVVVLINAVLAGYVVFVLLGGGDWMPMLRFGVHILPLLYLLIQLGLEQLFERGSATHWARALVLVLMLGQVGYLIGGSFEQRFIAGVGAGSMVPPVSPRIVYLAEHTAPGDTLAVIDAGQIAYRLPGDVRIVDMVGLADSHIAHRPVQLPGGILGRGDAFGKWDVDYVLGQDPRFVQVNLTGQSADGLWETNFTGTTLLVNDARFRDAYKLVTEPGVSGIFVRRDGR